MQAAHTVTLTDGQLSAVRKALESKGVLSSILGTDELGDSGPAVVEFKVPEKLIKEFSGVLFDLLGKEKATLIVNNIVSVGQHRILVVDLTDKQEGSENVAS